MALGLSRSAARGVFPGPGSNLWPLRWQVEKGMTEDELVEWHHRHNGHVLGWTPGVGDGQGGLACFGSWGCKESDVTGQLN